MTFSKSNNIFTIRVLETSTSKLTNFSREIAKENLIRDLKPIYKVARIFGIAPYKITNTEYFTWSKNGLIYSAAHFILCCYAFMKRILEFVNKNPPMKVTILYTVMLSFSALSMALDIINCIIFDKMQQEFFDYVIYYDESMKFKNNMKYSFVTCTWIVLFGVFLIMLAIIMAAFQFVQSPFLTVISVLIFSSTLGIGILKFLVLAITVSLRFRDLNFKLLKDLPSIVNPSKNRNLNFRKSWQMHEYLTSAAKILNSMYSLKLLVWFIILFLTDIMQIFGALSTSHKFVTVASNFLISSFYMLLLLALATVCHWTSFETILVHTILFLILQANRIGGILSSPKNIQRYSPSEKQDIFLIGQYFQFNSFQFSAFGFFNVNLSVVLTVASAITTYVVILSSPNEH